MDLERMYWSYVRFTKIVLSATGLWPCKSKLSTDIIKRVISRFFCVYVVATSFGVVYFCYFHRKNLEVLLKGVGFFGVIILMLVKMLAFINHREQIAELVNALGLLSTSQFEDSKNTPLRLGLLRRLRRYTQAQSVTVAYTIIAHNVVPLIRILRQNLSGVNPITYIYPFAVKFPWEKHDGGIIYAMQYFYHVVLGWVCFSSIVGPDSLFCLLILQLHGQLRVLASNFRNISPGKDFDRNFAECVRQHCHLMRCKNLFQKVYGVIIFTSLTSNGLVMCTLMFQLSQMKSISFGKAFGFIFYFASKFVQALMYSWCGTLLTTESKAVNYAAFESNWTGCSDPKKARNVLMVTFQPPFVLTACNFSDVSLGMFTAILNTTMSYYCLLKTVNEK